MNIRNIMFVYGAIYINDSVNRRGKTRCWQNEPAASCFTYLPDHARRSTSYASFFPWLIMPIGRLATSHFSGMTSGCKAPDSNLRIFCHASVDKSAHRCFSLNARVTVGADPVARSSYVAVSVFGAGFVSGRFW